jgi:hypothetical protein
MPSTISDTSYWGLLRRFGNDMRRHGANPQLAHYEIEPAGRRPAAHRLHYLLVDRSDTLKVVLWVEQHGDSMRVETFWWGR